MNDQQLTPGGTLSSHDDARRLTTHNLLGITSDAMRGKLFKFVPHPSFGDAIGVTYDWTGANLPVKGARWRLIGSLGMGAEEGPRLAASASEILATVDRNGYFIGGFKAADERHSGGAHASETRDSRANSS